MTIPPDFKAWVRRAQSERDPWRVGNEALYELCRTHPRHRDKADIIAKVWLIGRAYSASLERSRSKAGGAEVDNDEFYTGRLTEVIRASELDRKLKALKPASDVNVSNVSKVLDVHACVMNLFKVLIGKIERSLASKYLYFHRPNFFFIFDSRAKEGIARLKLTPRSIRVPVGADVQYATFVAHALGLRHYVSDMYQTTLGG